MKLITIGERARQNAHARSPYNLTCQRPSQEALVEDTPVPGYRLLATNPERLGGKVTIVGTRFTVSFVLACLAKGMSHEDIVREYSEFPPESVQEVLRFAAEVTDRSDVAARTVIEWP